MKILCVVGARPNFMKVVPVHLALAKLGHESVLVHTGQHYDDRMSDVFFADLGIAKPALNLGVGSGSHAAQTARIMTGFEPVLLDVKPDGVLVAGDVNSTLACALVAVKLHVRTAHLEAGLRSRDRGMPEEINRIATDSICDLLLTPSPDGDENLRHEGIPEERIARVGNTMIDSLRTHLARARDSGGLARAGVTPGEYALVTMHRPSNVDDESGLRRLVAMLGTIAERLPVVFPMHPRTRAHAAALGLRLDAHAGLRVTEPLGYLEFLGLEADAKVVLTDSGGVQEETTALGVPCLTFRTSTERPVTVSEGTNTIVGTDTVRALREVEAILAGGGKRGRIPALWDGAAGMRAAEALVGRWAKVG